MPNTTNNEDITSRQQYLTPPLGSWLLLLGLRTVPARKYSRVKHNTLSFILSSVRHEILYNNDYADVDELLL